MARLARIVLPGMPHHAVMRAKPGCALFETSSDYSSFRGLLAQTARQFSVEILAACLLRDHVHLVATPSTSDGLARFIGEACRRHSRSKGNIDLFRGRFRSCPLDPQHAEAAIAYVLHNPGRLGLSDWYWTLGAARVAAPSEALVEAIRSATRTGRPAGDAHFFARVEYDLGRVVRPKKRGRKVKW